jgi:hypothetical protein
VAGAGTAPAHDGPRVENGSFMRGLRAAAEKASAALDGLQDLGLHPRLGSVCPNSGPAPGLAFWKPALGGPGVDVFAAASATFEGDRLFELRLGRVPHRPGEIPSRRDGLEWIPAFEAGGQAARHFLYADVRRLEVVSGRFLSGASDPMQASSYDLVGGYRLTPRLSASLRAGVLEIEPRAGAVALEPEASLSAELLASPSVAWKHEYFRVASEIALDTRDRARRPARGQLVSALFERYDDRRAGGSFTRVSLDARHFQPLGSTRHVLALRAVGSRALTRDAASVPFYLQSLLGGSQSLRGYDVGRFSGNKLLAFSAEYRFAAADAVELAAFYDLGRAWGGDATLATPGFVGSYGLGLRLKGDERVLLRADLAKGSEGLRLHLGFGYSF